MSCGIPIGSNETMFWCAEIYVSIVFFNSVLRKNLFFDNLYGVLLRLLCYLQYQESQNNGSKGSRSLNILKLYGILQSFSRGQPIEWQADGSIDDLSSSFGSKLAERKCRYGVFPPLARCVHERGSARSGGARFSARPAADSCGILSRKNPKGRTADGYELLRYR